VVSTYPRRAPDQRRAPVSNRMRVVLALIVLTLVSTLVSAVTYAAFSASTSSAASSFSTGTLSLSNDHSATAVLNLGSDRLLPGDTITGYVQVTNSGNEDVVNYQLSTSLPTGVTANALTTGSNGLHLYIQRCSVAWSTGSCAGTTTNLIGTASAPVAAIGTNSLLVSPANAFCTSDAAAAGERAARAVTCDSSIVGSTDFLKVVVSLPSAADNSYQTLSTSLNFTFSGGQGGNINF
jgi:spore coat-associated protein N